MFYEWKDVKVKFWNSNFYVVPEVKPEPPQASKMESFVPIVNR